MTPTDLHEEGRSPLKRKRSTLEDQGSDEDHPSRRAASSGHDAPLGLGFSHPEEVRSFGQPAEEVGDASVEEEHHQEVISEQFQGILAEQGDVSSGDLNPTFDKFGRSVIDLVFTSRLAAPIAEVNLLKQKIANLEAQLAVPLTEVDDLRQKVSSLEAVLAEKEEELEVSRVELSQSQLALETAEVIGAQLRVKLTAAEGAQAELMGHCSELEQELEGTRLAREDLEVMLGQQAIAVESLTEELKSEQQISVQLRSEVAQLRERAMEAEKKAQVEAETAKMTREKYWGDCIHCIRTAAYHALPDFEWAPVERLLNKHDSHPKVDALLLEEYKKRMQASQSGSDAGAS